MTLSQLFFKVPNRRTKTFVGRQPVLDTLDRVLLPSNSPNGPRVAVMRAMGGQGKTQIALHFCFSKKSNPFTAVFWLDATSEASVRSSLETVFDIIKPPGTMRHDTDGKVDFVLEYLSQRSEPWLLVFDNYDKLDYQIGEFLPQGPAGAILVTSRNGATRELVVDDSERYIELEGLAEDAAIELLLRISNAKSQDSAHDHASDIVRRLGYHALAITQAATYILKQRVRLSDFMTHYETRRKMILETTSALTEYRRKLGGQDRETALSVFTTWELSFQQLQEEFNENDDKVTINILALHAFFDVQDVSEFILREAWHYMDRARGTPVPHMLAWLDELGPRNNWDTNKYQDKIAHLAELSLLQSWTRSEADHLVHVTMHPLIAEWVRLRLSDHDRDLNIASAWLCCGLIGWAGQLEDEDKLEISSSMRNEILRHIQVLMMQEEYVICGLQFDDDRATQNLDEARLWCGYALYGSDSNVLAEELLKSVVLRSESRTRQPCRTMGHALVLISNILEDREEFATVKAMLELNLEMLRKCLRSDREYVLEIEGILASALWQLGFKQEAEARIRDMLARLEGKHGHDSLSWSSLAGRFGRLLGADCRYSEAESFLRDSWLAECTREGPDSLNALVGLQGLAHVIVDPHRIDEQLDLYDRAIAGWTQFGGSDHPSAVRCQKHRETALQRSLRSAEIDGRRQLENDDFTKSLSDANHDLVMNREECLQDDTTLVSGAQPLTAHSSDPEIQERLAPGYAEFIDQLQTILKKREEANQEAKRNLEMQDAKWAGALMLAWKRWKDTEASVVGKLSAEQQAEFMMVLRESFAQMHGPTVDYSEDDYAEMTLFLDHGGYFLRRLLRALELSRDAVESSLRPETMSVDEWTDFQDFLITWLERFRRLDWI